LDDITNFEGIESENIELKLNLKEYIAKNIDLIKS